MSTSRKRRIVPRPGYRDERSEPGAAQKRPGPEGGVRDLNRKRRFEQLREAALDLFLAEGIESVTIDAIVEKAGVAKGLFYRYFADRAALVEALFAPLRDRTMEAFSRCEAGLRAANSKQTLSAAYQVLAEHLTVAIMESPRVALLYLQENRGPAEGARAPARMLADRVRARALELTHVAHDRGLLKPVDGRVTSRAVVGASESVLHAFLTGEDLGDPLAVPEVLVSMVLDGLRAPGVKTL